MNHTAEEMMTVAAARELRDGQVVFVGIDLPSRAANLARRLHAPGLVLVYESGTIDTRPDELPLSIGDGVLAETALSVVGVPEIFNYWLQAGRMDVGFLSGAQIDRYANLNTTVIGEYDEPDVRLPGSGGAPEISAGCREVIVVMRHRKRAFVDQVDFVTTFGHGTGPTDRALLGLRGAGPVRVITDLGVLEPDPESRELVLTALHPGATVEQVRAETGWSLEVSDELGETTPPTERELTTLRAMRTVGARLLAGEDRGDRLLDGRLLDPEPAEHARPALELEQREQDVLGADEVVPQPQRLAEGQLQRLLGLRVERDQRRELVGGRWQTPPWPPRAAPSGVTPRAASTCIATPSRLASSPSTRCASPISALPAARASFCAATTMLRARGVNRVKSCAGSFATNRFWTACLVTPMLRPMSVHDAPARRARSTKWPTRWSAVSPRASPTMTAPATRSSGSACACSTPAMRSSRRGAPVIRTGCVMRQL